jgi:hypothetical protein
MRTSYARTLCWRRGRNGLRCTAVTPRHTKTRFQCEFDLEPQPVGLTYIGNADAQQLIEYLTRRPALEELVE